MQWIQANSRPSDAFSGSMQLLAGVKLCTGRTLTNHPHFEDKALRDRTKELYSMYSKLGPGEVHGALRKYNTSYVILEDSICLAHRERCSVPDIMDLSNGHVSIAFTGNIEYRIELAPSRKPVIERDDQPTNHTARIVKWITTIVPFKSRSGLEDWHWSMLVKNLYLDRI